MAEHVCTTPAFLAGGVVCYACRETGVQDHICNEECFEALEKSADEARKIIGVIE